MSAVRPRDPEVRAEPWTSAPVATPTGQGDPAAEVAVDQAALELLDDRLAASVVHRDPPRPAAPRRPTWTQLGAAGSALAAPWVWAVVASRLPLPTEQQGVALLAGWLGMAVVVHVVADPRRDP